MRKYTLNNFRKLKINVFEFYFEFLLTINMGELIFYVCYLSYHNFVINRKKCLKLNY